MEGTQETDMSKIAVTNILLVEDDKVDIMNVQRSFKKANISNPLFIANNGIEALEILRNNSETVEMPVNRRLILLDLNMPKMGGIEFLQELRADPALCLTPVIILTTSDQEKDRMKAYNFNVSGYILKPVTFVSFAEVMVALNRYWTLCEIP
jgi:CheY-like chemotaxis protein